jgi:hypothetical protein
MASFFGGTKSKIKPFNKQSLNTLLSQLKGGGLQGNPTYEAGNSYLQNLLSNDPSAFEAQAAPEIRNFNENIAPGIAERFAGLGTGAGASNSSALAQSLSQAGSMLQERLASMRSQQQQNALPLALQYAQQPITNQQNAANSIPGQHYQTQGQPGFLQSAAGSFLGSLSGQAGTNAANSIGSGLNNVFSGLKSGLKAGGI